MTTKPNPSGADRGRAASRPSAALDAPASLPRAAVGGFLMGLANLVPGISGGTMILAIGLYDRFIAAVADVTRLRPRRASVVLLATMALGLVAAVLLGSGLAVRLVSEHRWAMYALFVGMTLGGAPDLVRLARPFRLPAWLAFTGGVAAMAWFAFQTGETALEPTLPTFVGVGAAGSASMILPGISGSYVLLILGMYDTVIGALSLSEVRADPAGSLRIIAPVVLGAVLGIALLSNVLKSVLTRFSSPAHGALLGLLVGSVLGLYPFQESVHPELARRTSRKAIESVVVEGADVQDVAASTPGLSAIELAAHSDRWRGRDKGDLKRASLETRTFRPTSRRIMEAIGLFALGVLLTRLLGRRAG
jgi:putative membrane protein